MLRINSLSASFFRVLLVEDDPRMRRLISTTLTILGFRKITEVGNGREALDLLEAYRTGFRYDFIITDWEMPIMNGLELVSAIRQNIALPDYTIPVLMCTGMAQKRHVLEARDFGATEFIAKPFTVDQLAQKITHLLSNPRQFVICDTYVGPCRRRRNTPLPEGMEDRRKPQPAATQRVVV